MTLAASMRKFITILFFIVFAKVTFCQMQQNVADISYNADELFRACSNGDIIKVNALIKMGINVDIKNEHGQTPLFKAAESGHIDIVKLLVQEGADINGVDETGTSTLSASAFWGRKNVCRYLIQNGADIENQGAYNNKTPLMWACSEGHWTVCKLLIDHGANPKAEAYNEGWTVLHEAVVAHTSERMIKKICNLLIKNGAVVDAIEDCGITPLFEAVYGERLTVCRFLLDNNADVNYRIEKDGRVVLMEAALRGSSELCKIFIKAGADIKVKDNLGKTALHYSAEYGRTDVCRLLLEHGAELNDIDNQGKNPTDWAVENGHIETANYLKAKQKK